MPLMYLPMLMYKMSLDMMFLGWGYRPQRATIIADNENTEVSHSAPRAPLATVTPVAEGGI
jgi:hypothetical protein